MSNRYSLSWRMPSGVHWSCFKSDNAEVGDIPCYLHVPPQVLLVSRVTIQKNELKDSIRCFDGLSMSALVFFYLWRQNGTKVDSYNNLYALWKLNALAAKCHMVRNSFFGYPESFRDIEEKSFLPCVEEWMPCSFAVDALISSECTGFRFVDFLPF